MHKINIACQGSGPKYFGKWQKKKGKQMGKCIGETNFDSKKVPLQMSSHKMSNLLLKNSSI